MSKRELVVYGLYFEGNGIRYVGMTSNSIKRRVYEHRRCAKQGMKRPVYAWMRKYGPDNVKYIILERCNTHEELVRQEIWWIAEARRYESLMNLTDGGEAFLGWESTPEHKEALSKALKGKTRSPETRELMSQGMKGNKNCVGRKVSAETRAKMSAWQKGVPRNPIDDVTKLPKNTGQHVRWHVNRGIVKSDCLPCQ